MTCSMWAPYALYKGVCLFLLYRRCFCCFCRCCCCCCCRRRRRFICSWQFPIIQALDVSLLLSQHAQPPLFGVSHTRGLLLLRLAQNHRAFRAQFVLLQSVAVLDARAVRQLRRGQGAQISPSSRLAGLIQDLLSRGVEVAVPGVAAVMAGKMGRVARGGRTC